MDDLRGAEAEFRISASPQAIGAVVRAAVALLEEGVDTPSLRILAGEDRAGSHELQQFLDATLRELGLAPLGADEAILASAAAVATDLVAGRLPATDAAFRLWQLYTMIDLDRAPDALIDLVLLADGVLDTPQFVSEADLVAAARAFVAGRA